MDKSDILHKYPPSMENLLLILHEFQDHNPRNYLSRSDLQLVAKYLNIPFGQIYGVVSYYSLFSLTPRGKHIIRICCSPVCSMAGSNTILVEIGRQLGIGLGETTAEGVFTLESTECLGQCDTAPGMAIDEVYFGNLTPKRIKTILQKYPVEKKRMQGRHG